MESGLIIRYNPYCVIRKKCLIGRKSGVTPSENPIIMSLSPLSSQESCGSLSPSSMGGHVLSLDFTRPGFLETNQAQLIMLVAPETHFRYRYDTEMSGAHGSLQADRGTREKQIPTVQLVGYTGPAVIRVSLATCNQGQRYPHPHHLFVREKLYQRRYKNLDGKQIYKTGHFIDPHYIFVSESDYSARFEGMCIISAKKEQFQRVLRQKLQERGHQNPLHLDQKVQEALSHVDMAFVSLCFEAFRYDNEILGEAICAPIYSEPIANAKNASSSKLKIARINIVSGSSQGGDSVWLLVEKINKSLIVRFFEQAPDGTLVWESVVESDKLELHYQYAVIFDTPPYRDPNISHSVTVSMRLERRVVPYDFSDPETFTYEPCNNSRYTRNDVIIKRETTNKRPMADLFPSYMLPSKRKPDDFISSDPFYNSNPEFQEILMELFKLDNVEMDNVPAGKQELLYKFLKLFLSHARDGDVKSVTEKIGRLFLRPDDLRLQDAASTLLSLRSGGIAKCTIHEAIANNEVEAAIQAGCSPGDLNENGQTGLHVAVEKCNLKMVNLMLNHENVQKWLNIPDKNNQTALQIAKEKKHSGILNALQNAGAIENVKKIDDAILEKLARILNIKWEYLASLMDLNDFIPIANKEKNPSLFFLTHVQNTRGLDLRTLRNLLDALDEKESIAFIDETLAKQFM